MLHWSCARRDGICEAVSTSLKDRATFRVVATALRCRVLKRRNAPTEWGGYNRLRLIISDKWYEIINVLSGWLAAPPLIIGGVLILLVRAARSTFTF